MPSICWLPFFLLYCYFNINVCLLFAATAIVLSFFNVTPSLRRTKEKGAVDIQDTRDFFDSIDENYKKKYLIVSDNRCSYQFFIKDASYVFRRIDNKSDYIMDFDTFKITDLTKRDISIPFSSIKTVFYYDNDKIFQSGAFTLCCTGCCRTGKY